MWIEFDPSSDSAYVHLVNVIEDGEARRQIEVELKSSPGTIALDFDRNGFLLGIEILEATRLLRREVIEQARLIDQPPE